MRLTEVPGSAATSGSVGSSGENVGHQLQVVDSKRLDKSNSWSGAPQAPMVNAGLRLR
jgi:hypothetical protein